MATALQKQNTANSEANILNSFARVQLGHVSRHLLEDSPFLVLAACAFFYGAEAQLRKQSKMSFQRSQIKLIALIKSYFRMNTRTALHLVMSIDAYAEKYYLIENIVSQGKKHADKWLNCEDCDDQYLGKLAAQYQHQSMFDLGIESISPKYESQQKQMFYSVNQSVKKLRQRLLIILVFAGVIFSIIIAVSLR